MKTRTFIPQWCGALSRPLFLFILSFTLALTGCEKAKDLVQPSATELITSQTQDAKKDDDYKRNKTGQYVSKDVQVSGYEDGSERPTRPKFDAADAITSLNILPDEPCDGCGGGGYIPPKSDFLSSEGIGSGDIYALRLISDNTSNIAPSEGHIRINVDLNKGAGGKYIYLTFTRNPLYSYENDGAHAPITYDIPLTHLKVVSYTQFEYHNQVSNIAPGAYYRHLYKFTGGSSIPVDLNDGAGGKYIFGHVSRQALYGSPIKEVGVLYGNSSQIQPPTGWVKVPGDLNENAGGDYIYFCYRK